MDSENKGQRIVFFDGRCKLCHYSVNFIIKYDKNRLFKYAFTGAQDAYKLEGYIGEIIRKNNTIVLLEDRRLSTRSTAILRIVASLSGWPSLMGIFIILPKPLRDWIYDIISRNRYKWFGNYEACMIPDKDIEKLFVEANEINLEPS